MDKEDIEDFEDEKLEVAKKNKKGGKDGGDAISIESSNVSEGSASATLLSSHAMRMGLYTINLGTKMGQKLHTGHMLFFASHSCFHSLGAKYCFLPELYVQRSRNHGCENSDYSSR